MRGQNSTQFQLVNQTDTIGLLFNSIWGAMFAVFSNQLQQNDENQIIDLCISGFMNSIKICGYFNMKTERDAFVGSLNKFTGLNNPRKEIDDKDILCIKALLKVGLDNGNCLKESWYYVLDCVSRLNYFMTEGMGIKHDHEVFGEDNRRMTQ